MLGSSKFKLAWANKQIQLRTNVNNISILYTKNNNIHQPDQILECVYRPSCPGQHNCKQQSRQPKHARAVHSCVNTVAHWLFIFEQHWMQSMQQHWLHIWPQQFEVAFTRISATSGNFGSWDPGRMFSAVAIRSPKPTVRLWSNIFLGAPESPISCGSPLYGTCIQRSQL